MPEFKVLIDTNVFIGLEDAGQIQPKFANLVRKCGQYGVRLFVHADAKQDIERDRNVERRDASLSRVRKFDLLSGIPMPLFGDEPTFIVPTRGNRIPGNTIRKVYLCRAQSNAIVPGDCLLFYRSKSPGFISSQAITSVAVAEGVTVTADHDQLVRLTAKRSVFSEEELRVMTLGDTRPIKVIDFLLAGHIEPPILIADLLRLGVLKAGPQSILQLAPPRFAPLRALIKLGFEL